MTSPAGANSRVLFQLGRRWIVSLVRLQSAVHGEGGTAQLAADPKSLGQKSPREVPCEVSSEVAGEVGADNGFVVTSTMSTRAAAGPAVPETLTDEWWALSEHLADVAQDVAGVELTTTTRMALIEMTVELLVLVTCWPGSPPPANPLAYLRTRRARMARHAGWLEWRRHRRPDRCWWVRDGASRLSPSR